MYIGTTESKSNSTPPDMKISSTSSKIEDEAYRVRVSEREKQKGNEFYKVGDLEEAIRYYTRSIDMAPTNHILYANRAMGYLKLDNPEKAEEDCSKSLSLDATYIKAWSRRGLARFKRGKYSEVCVLHYMQIYVL
jgi:tetratricopeptide (TPR) repeat protein